MSDRMIVAIDGPAGSGKSTVSKALARRLGVAYVDTGATYRVVAWRALRTQTSLDDIDALQRLAQDTMRKVAVRDARDLTFDGAVLGGEIRTPEVSEATSIVSAHPEVRSVVVPEQRRLVPPEGAVVEGRDIGTVVWPDADLKVYLDASPDVRVSRRTDQQGSPDGMAREITERDARDAHRPVGAMRPADDAVVIDTSTISADDVTERIVRLLHPAPAGRLYKIFRGILNFLLRYVFRIEVEGAENLPRYGAAILAPNHRSLIDHFVVASLTKRQVWFMGKAELFKNKQAARLLTALGAFPVKRGKPDRASLQRCLELLGDGQLVGIYPEGTRRPDSRFEEVEEGFAYIAVRSGAPIVPIGLSGTEAVFPKDKKLPRIVRIRVVVGKPFRLTAQTSGVLPRTKLREATAQAQQNLSHVMQKVEPR
jgi:cytidylate kinase